jgi:hypothetical protein
MAGNGEVLLQVSDFTLAGIDTTQRKTVVEGAILALEAEGSLLTLALGAGGTGWAVDDEFTIPSIPGAIGKVLTESGGAVETMSIIATGAGGTAGTDVATQAISPSTGAGLTVTTTVTAGGIIQITGWSITSNVLTFTAVNSLTTGGGQSINVQGFTGAQAFLNGNYTTSSATGTTIVVPKTAANGSGTQQGVAVVQPSYTTGGIPISYAFIDSQGNSRPIGTIGPLAVPTWIDAKTVAGSAYNYQVNTTVKPNLLRILNGITELSDQAAIPADTTAFRAEFVKGAF